MLASLLALAAGLQDAAGPPKDVIPPPILVAPPAPPPPPRPVTPGSARARANLASYVSDADYPIEALRNEEEGMVGFRLVVGPDGRVANCLVYMSSGAPSLDETTCAIMRRRARFSPALDYNGRPVGDTVSARIIWRMEREPPCTKDCPPDVGPRPVRRARPIMPLASLVDGAEIPESVPRGAAAATVNFVLTIGPDGNVADCAPTVTSWEQLGEATCGLMQTRARFTPGRDAEGIAVSDKYWGHVRWQGIQAPPIRFAPPSQPERPPPPDPR